MPNTGTSSAFPFKIDTFYLKKNAAYNKLTKKFEGDVIASAYKNKLDDAVFNIESELIKAPEYADTSLDLRITAVTALLKEVVTNHPYKLYIPEDTADFIGRAGIGNSWGTPCLYLSSFRPYYMETPKADQVKLKALWNTLSKTIPITQQFSISMDYTDEQKLTVTFNPGPAVVGTSVWVDTYDNDLGHAGNFIMSLILISTRQKTLS